MILYHLQRLIKKYTVCCKLENTKEGQWVSGEWVEGETTTTDIAGAIVPISEKRINNSGGDYKQGDCEFITTNPLELNSDTYILYKDKRYKLEDSTDYSDYADFYTYIARRVSAFDGRKEPTTGNA